MGHVIQNYLIVTALNTKVFLNYNLADITGELELLIPILCGIFLVENLSVILQVKYFQAGKKKGKKQRIFKRTPIHDHFRITMAQLDPECSYLFTKPNNVFHESKITVRFWIITIVLAAITIITLKIR